MTKLPKLPFVDIAVIGGSTAAIAAALRLKEQGLSVMVVGGRTYLGEDVCDSLRLMLPSDLRLDSPLARRLYGDFARTRTSVRPLQLKLELERALREQHIPYQLSTVPGELITDDQGAITAVTLCNRSGRQILPCRVVIDGTLRGEAARLANVPLSPPSASIDVIHRVVTGEAPLTADGEWLAEGMVEYVFNKETVQSTLWAHHLTGRLADGSWAAWMGLEQSIRNRSYRPGQHLSADGIFALTGERINAQLPPQPLAADYADLNPAQISACNGSLFVTGPIANIATDEAADILRHDNAIRWGHRIGDLVAANLPAVKPLGNTTAFALALPGPAQASEFIDDLRWQNRADISGKVIQQYTCLEEVDVLVVGGGTAGAPAAIAAAKNGAKTLLVEFCAGLGGVGTVGNIGSYYFGNRVGFTRAMDEAVSAKSPMNGNKNSWDIEAKMHWYHEQVSQHGGRIWYKSMACGALTEGTRVVGAIVATPQGRIAVRARCVIDATGSSDVAAAAGAETIRIGAEHVAVQGTGLPPRHPGARNTNTDYDFVDDNDVQDTTGAFSCARTKFSTAFDLGQLVDSRERRRIIGDVEVTPMDILLGRVFPDTINTAYSNFDTHGFTIHPFFMLVPPDHTAMYAHIPFRALLPKGLDGILVTGLGISAHRDAMPVLRMQACVQNQGYAAGLAAASCPAGNLRALDLPRLQRQLIAEGLLEQGMDNRGDSFPLDSELVDQAIEAAATGFETLNRVFTLPHDELIPKIRKAYKVNQDAAARCRYAHILGILGDATGLAVLKEVVQKTPWDEGWNYRGMGQFGHSMSQLDSRIIALGRCGDESCVDLLVEKASSLPAQAEFSHYRALSEAFIKLGSTKAVPCLEALLARPSIAGHVQPDLAARLDKVTDNHIETAVRNSTLIELHLARALVRLRPDHPVGKTTLQNYRHDQRGIFARHAKCILEQYPSK